MLTMPKTRPNDDAEYTDVARLTDHFGETVNAPIDYDNKLRFLGDEIKNGAVQGTLSEDAELIRDHLIALGHALYGQYNTSA